MAETDWAAALTGGSLVASLALAGVLLLALGVLFKVSWRTVLAAAVLVVAANLFVPGGAPHLVFTALRPLHALTTSHPRARVEEPPHPYPPDR